jgi:hypothetical protein
MLWFFVALQAMMPFIHAHAGAVQLNHSGLFHLHQVGSHDIVHHVTATSEHGAEIDVEQGRPLRIDALAPVDSALPATTRVLPDIVSSFQAGAGLPAPPPRFSAPAHTLPHALAPPAV